MSIQVNIRNMRHSQALEDRIVKKAEKLNQYYQHIQSCKVIVDVPERHMHQGKLFHVAIDVLVPGKTLVVSHKSNEKFDVAIYDAFKAMERKIKAYSDKRRGEVKRHVDVSLGYVKRLLPEDGYGFIQAPDGTEHYFSITNVERPAFNELHIGDSVRFQSAPSHEGWQAHRVIKNGHLFNNK